MMADAEFAWGDAGPHDLADSLEALDGALMQRLTEAMETWALRVEATAKRLVPVDSGRLRSSIANEVERTGTVEITAYIGSNVSYAPIIEFGRGPVHADEGYLRFKIDGEVFYRKQVAGTEAQPYLRPAVEEHREDLKRLVAQAVEKAVEDVS